ncbi:MAG: SurA N-terminal domain-containing protein [Muribaculaceae bacterium]|nr:SurA N-terminal domain-containing protein [Muribaculaceae bacterium]
MATLEKIRSKSVFLLVIIGLALLAFIIGDFFTSGRTLFGTGTTIAKVDGHSIDINEFQRRVELVNQQYQQSGQKVDQAVLQQQVLDQMIVEALFKGEVDKLGLTVTPAELTEAMLGSQSQFVDQMVQSQTGIESARVANDMAFNPAKYGLQPEQAEQIKEYWINLEQQIEEQLLQAKFANLFSGAIVANKLDAKAIYDENATTSNIVYAKKPYTAIPDDQVEVSDAEIKAEYDRTRNRYRINEETRSVNYIAVNIAPSTEDRAAAGKAVEEAVTALRQNDGTKGIADLQGFITDRQTMSVIRDNLLKKFADSAAVNDVKVINSVGDNYTIAKLLGKKAEVDSVNIDFLAVQGSRAQVDSLVNALNNGTTWEQASTSPLVSQAQDSTWLSLVDANYASIKDLLTNANVGTYFAPDTLDQGGRIFRVRARRQPVPVYDLAVVTYTVEPSTNTINKLTEDLQEYIDKNKNAADFAANAAAANYMAMPAQISISTPVLGRLEDSRSIIAWAMNAKKGQVSPIFDDNSDRLVVVAVNDIYKDYIPYTDSQVNPMLTSQVRNDKKAEKLIEQYKGKAKDVAGYAQVMDVAVDTAAVTFGQFFIPGIGAAESELTARVANAKPGQLVGPVKTNSGVVVFSVTGVDASERPFNQDEAANQYNQTRGISPLMRNLNGVLLGNKKVTNNILKFYGNRE